MYTKIYVFIYIFIYIFLYMCVYSYKNVMYVFVGLQNYVHIYRAYGLYESTTTAITELYMNKTFLTVLLSS